MLNTIKANCMFSSPVTKTKIAINAMVALLIGFLLKRSFDILYNKQLDNKAGVEEGNLKIRFLIDKNKPEDTRDRTKLNFGNSANVD